MRPDGYARLAVLMVVAALLPACTAAPGANTPGALIFAKATGHAGPIARSTGGGPYITEGLPCAGCHGASGQGTGIAPPITRAVLGSKHTITHKPSPGSPPSSAVTEGPWTAAQTADVVRTGVTPEGNHLGGRMPRWQLDDQDAAALAQYLGTL